MYAGSSSVTLAPWSMYSLYSSTIMVSLPLLMVQMRLVLYHVCNKDVTDANLTSGYVFVDTIKPNLTINGNETIIVELYSEYIDQGANVTDEDVAYNLYDNIQH